jgi:hypothetical protein
MTLSENIYTPTFQEALECSTFICSESRRRFVFPGIIDIKVTIHEIEVSSDDDRFRGLEYCR